MSPEEKNNSNNERNSFILNGIFTKILRKEQKL